MLRKSKNRNQKASKSRGKKVTKFKLSYNYHLLSTAGEDISGIGRLTIAANSYNSEKITEKQYSSFEDIISEFVISETPFDVKTVTVYIQSITKLD